MAQYGIDGPLKRQADIFASPPPAARGPNPLGNFVLDDPGFADVETARQEAQEESESAEKGMESIVSNPYASPVAGGSRKKNAKPDVNFSEYNVARIGMSIAYYSLLTMLVAPAIMFPLGFLTSFVPVIAPVIGIIGSVIGIAFLLAVGLFFVSQIICIFAPNKNERLFAGLAVGALVLAFLLPIIGLLMGGFAGLITGDEGGGAAQAAAAAVGIVVLILVVSSYLLALSNMFFFITYFKKIGQNIRSKELRGSANLAMITWIVAIIGAILCSIAIVVVTLVMSDSPENASKVIGIIGLVNLLLGFAVMCTLLSMLSTAIKRTGG
jgi:MFS family permease